MNLEVTTHKMSSEDLELILQTHFMEALKDSGLRSFSFSDSVLVKMVQIAELPVAILLFRAIEGESLAEIDFVATAQGFKRRGCSTALVSDLSEEFAEIWLELKETNESALLFYQKIGFLTQGRRPSYYEDGSAALNMVKTRQA